MSHKPQKQIADAKRQPVEFDDAAYLLLECINSGQVSEDQLVAHVAAGELDNEREQK